MYYFIVLRLNTVPSECKFMFFNYCHFYSLIKTKMYRIPILENTTYFILNWHGENAFEAEKDYLRRVAKTAFLFTRDA